MLYLDREGMWGFHHTIGLGLWEKVGRYVRKSG